MKRALLITALAVVLCGAFAPAWAWDLRIGTGENNPGLVSAPDLDAALDQAVTDFSRLHGIEVELARETWEDHSDSLLSGLVDEESEHPCDLVLVDWISVAGLAADELVLPLHEAGIAPMDENVAEDAAFFPLAWGGEYSAGLAVTRSAMDSGRLEWAAMFIEYLAEVFPEPGLPDLIVEDVVAPESTEDGHLILELAVRNIGDAPAHEVLVHLTDGEGSVVGETFIDAVEPGEIRYVGTEVYVPGEDMAQVWVKIDPEAMLREHNIHNNLAHIDIPFMEHISLIPQTPKSEKSAFVIATDPGISGVRGANAKVASNGTDYMTIWTECKPGKYNTHNIRIVGANYSSSGTKKSSTFVVNPTYAKVDSLALEYGGGVYLAVWVLDYWYGKPNLVQAAIINSKGSVSGSPITIASCTGDVRTASVAWTGKDFMVGYTEGSVIKARFVGPSGGMTSAFTIASSSSSNWYSNYELPLGYTPGKDQGFILVNGGTDYPQAPSINLTGIWFTRKGNSVSVDATKIHHKHNLTQSNWLNRQDSPVVGADGSGNYLALWENNLGKKYPDIYGALVSGQPTSTLSASMAVVKGKIEKYAALAFDGNNHIAVYQHGHGCKAYVGAVRVSPKGLKSASTFFNNSKANLVLGVDVASNGNNAFIVFENHVPPSDSGLSYHQVNVMGMLVK